MEYLNEDMDDLFRKAGEQYPLKTNNSDWNGVLGRLQPQVGGVSSYEFETGRKGNNKKKFLWLLLLLPFSMITILYFSGSSEKRNVQVAQKTIPSRLSTAGKKAPANTMSASGVAILERRINKSVRQQQTAHLYNNILKSSLAAISIKTQRHSANSNENLYQRADNRDFAAEKLSQASSSPNKKDSSENPTPARNSLTEKDQAARAAPDKNPAGAGPDQVQKSIATASVKEPVVKGQTGQKESKPAKVSQGQEKGMYISLLAGPDFSTVKFQPVKNIGYSIGLEAGYRFSKHISFEAGLFWDKKQYYSDGKYFNTSKTNIPNAVSIKDLDGSCNMFEIPVALRYDFAYNHKGRFFATFGLSAYIMNKENYAYNAEGYGNSWSQNIYYHNSGNNLFSIMQFSAGYVYKWRKIGQIRIEPYVKIPLAGVGIGNLPIASAGLHLGITHPFGL